MSIQDKAGVLSWQDITQLVDVVEDEVHTVNGTVLIKSLTRKEHTDLIEWAKQGSPDGEINDSRFEAGAYFFGTRGASKPPSLDAAMAALHLRSGVFKAVYQRIMEISGLRGGAVAEVEKSAPAE